MVAESGYDGFILNLDVYFHSKEEPKKVKFSYDLYLRVGQPVSNLRLEKLTFQNPSDDFRKKLLSSGGLGYRLYHQSMSCVKLTRDTIQPVQRRSSLTLLIMSKLWY
ncbi:hypothetical protein JTE90_004209 [Oedothorax gibbosus]|uniref:YEATS domain-containing protein n=1 Tax=Oedothorax gibbosus TaxID=931172 RepID=A0AAV6V4R5_9ARAC|nr:hypothetical protein JTE90_004209 [Oedothorax gibbosus]